MRGVALVLLAAVLAALAARLATGWTGTLFSGSARGGSASSEVSSPHVPPVPPVPPEAPDPAASLAVGATPPSFDLLDQDGRRVVVGGPAARWRVITFVRESDVPAHGSPWCRLQLCSLRDVAAEFAALDVDVVAIGVDPPTVLAAFRRAQGFEFPLLSDPRGEMARAYGVWNVTHARRASFVLDPAGVLRHADVHIRLTRHGADLVERLRVLRR